MSVLFLFVLIGGGHVMKINDSQRLASLQAYRTGTQPKDAARGVKGSGVVRKDDVQISFAAKELLQEAQAGQQTDRAQKLEQLRAAVENGSYKVDAEKIAEKLLKYLK